MKLEKFSNDQYEFLTSLIKKYHPEDFGDKNDPGDGGWAGELFPLEHPFVEGGRILLKLTWKQEISITQQEYLLYKSLPGQTWLMNALPNSIFPLICEEGTHLLYKITLEEFCTIINDGNFASALGHRSSVDTISALTGVDCSPGVDEEGKLLRKQVDFSDLSNNFLAAIVRPGKRLPEGKLLSEAELKQLPLDFYKIVRKV